MYPFYSYIFIKFVFLYNVTIAHCCGEARVLKGYMNSIFLSVEFTLISIFINLL